MVSESKKEGEVFIASINKDNLYFSNKSVFDPTGMDYSAYDPANIVVYAPSNISVSDLKIVDNDVYYLSGTGLYKVRSTNPSELIHDFGVEVYDLQIQSAKIYVGTGAGLYTANLSDLMAGQKRREKLPELLRIRIL